MAEERKDSFAETVDTAASAAHTVKGAIKAGKAISGAAKGAAAGGPYGAVAGAVWAGRKHIGKIVAVIVILLLLPVLFVLMLPGLIFGGLINAFSPSDTEQPVLNSETAIVENANDITFTINSILGEALDDVMARIEADFASSGADQMEVKNPYSSGPVYNANLIVSQYCAARDEDFESISLDDLAAVLRENKEHLYSYTSVRESREVTSEDPETGKETTTTEIWMVYTIRYNGESYLADHVFALTDEQKELASDYRHFCHLQQRRCSDEMALQIRDAGKGADVERPVPAAFGRAVPRRRCAWAGAGRQHGTGIPDAHQHRRGQARLFHAGRQLRPFLFSHK